jgi:hypothetical protein
MCGHRWVLVVVAVELGVDAAAGVTAVGLVAGFPGDEPPVAAWAIAPPARTADTPSTAATLRAFCRDIAHLLPSVGILGRERHHPTLGITCERQRTVV